MHPLPVILGLREAQKARSAEPRIHIACDWALVSTGSTNAFSLGSGLDGLDQRGRAGFD